MVDLEYFNAPRVQFLREQAKEAKTEAERLTLAKALFTEIRRNSQSVVDKLESGVSVANLDEVHAAYANEMKKHTKAVLNAFKGLKLSQEEQGRIATALMDSSDKRFKQSFDTIQIKRPHDQVEVTNLDEIIIPSTLKVNNIDDLKKYFDTLGKVIKDTFNVEIPAPVVNIEAPKVDIPKTEVNIPETDLKPITESLKKVKQVLLDSRKAKNPLAVRLSDGKEFIEALRTLADQQQIMFDGSANNAPILKQIKASIQNQDTPATIGDGSKAVTSAGTAEALASSTACKKVIITAKSTNTGKVYYGGSSVSSTSGAYIYAGATVTLEIDDLSKIYIDVDTNGEGVQYSYVA